MSMEMAYRLLNLSPGPWALPHYHRPLSFTYAFHGQKFGTSSVCAAHRTPLCPLSGAVLLGQLALLALGVRAGALPVTSPGLETPPLGDAFFFLFFLLLEPGGPSRTGPWVLAAHCMLRRHASHAPLLANSSLSPLATRGSSPTASCQASGGRRDHCRALWRRN